ncbi:hypothetical protein AQ490_09460 [Wenjunlia vitaminophila]|uniref:Uncharacterized protein n=1 Tax=Wenjunlia vitaminophila TaxID=76728 RepID=A0A0T6LM96_WENVI|nr:hypothetical protein [Wenjunlia vitaminophila]KRV46978.1 hypothetical protein AQ490_09460 [Wenjunlia vitaminophila]
MSRCTVDDWTSSAPDRKHEQVRWILESPYPPVPADLTARAASQGRRMLHRRLLLRRLLLVTATLAVVALVVLAVVTWPGDTPSGPPATPPPVSG